MTSWLENNLQKVITNPATHNIMLSAISKCRTWLLLVLLPILFSNCQSQLPDDVELAYRELPDQIDFNIHIRPLLSDRCYACHGPDKNTRKADLRLDIEKDAFERLQTSGKAFVKGNLKKSIAWQRIISDDPEFQMPPPDSHLELSPTEKALIARWIEQGAKWKKQ